MSGHNVWFEQVWIDRCDGDVNEHGPAQSCALRSWAVCPLSKHIDYTLQGDLDQLQAVPLLDHVLKVYGGVLAEPNLWALCRSSKLISSTK